MDAKSYGWANSVKKIDMSGLHAPYVNGSSDPTGTPVLLDLVSSAGQKKCTHLWRGFI